MPDLIPLNVAMPVRWVWAAWHSPRCGRVVGWIDPYGDGRPARVIQQTIEATDRPYPVRKFTHWERLEADAQLEAQREAQRNGRWPRLGVPEGERPPHVPKWKMKVKGDI